MDWVVGYERFWGEKLDNLGRYLDARHGAGDAPGATPNEGTNP